MRRPLIYRLASDGQPTLVLEVDNVFSVGTGREVQLTDNPVEEGVDITDHQVEKPEAHEVEALVTDYPAEGGHVPGRARAAWDTLTELQQGKSMLAVVLPMVGEKRQVRLLRFDSTFSSATGTDSLRFKATFREVRMATSQRVPALKRKETSKKPTLELGQQSASPADAATAEKSRTLLKQFLDFMRGEG